MCMACVLRAVRLNAVDEPLTYLRVAAAETVRTIAARMDMAPSAVLQLVAEDVPTDEAWAVNARRVQLDAIAAARAELDQVKAMVAEDLRRDA